MALPEIIALLWRQKAEKSVVHPLLLCSVNGFFSALVLLFVFYVFIPQKWYFCMNCCYWFDFRWVVKLLCSLSNNQTLAPASNPSSFSSLLFYRVWTWSGLGHVAPGLSTGSSSHVRIPLASPQPGGREASSWEGLNGTGPFQAHRRPLTKTTQEEETTRQSEPEPEPPPPLFTMATNREHQLRHMTGFPRAMYPFTFNSMRSHSPFDLLASSHLFGRFGADLPKEMAALCE